MSKEEKNQTTQITQEIDDLSPQEKKRIITFYNKRLKILRKAREHFQQNEIKMAVDEYSHYLNGLAMWKRTTEEELSPDSFDRGQDLAELLLISHVYWDLAKAYDRSATLRAEVVRCLDQFCKFTIGFKYQYANAQVVKKFIKRPIIRNKREFQKTYEKVRIKTKGCYVSTYSLGHMHPVTIELKNFRDTHFIQTAFGREILNFYEGNSPRLVTFFLRHKLFGRTVDFLLIKPLLYGIFFVLRFLRII